MKDTLRKLLELQHLDDSLRDMRVAQERLVGLRKDNIESLEVFDEMLSTQSEHLEEARRFCREKQSDLSDTQETLKRSRGRMSKITSQRELTALNKELNAGRRANLERTEELSTLEAQLGEAEADHAKRIAERDALSTEMSTLENDLQGRLDAAEARASDVNDRRMNLRKALPPALVGRYSRVAKSRNGVAVADCPDGTCAGCNMSVLSQVYIKVQRMESLEYCSNCNRMLVFKAGFAAI